MKINYNVDKYNIFILFDKFFNIVASHLNFIKLELLLTVFKVQINVLINKYRFRQQYKTIFKSRVFIDGDIEANK